MSPEVFVYMWWCGDDYCDCTQPIVEIRSTEIPFSFGWTAPTRIAEGPFLSQGYGAAEPEEIKAQKKWLRDAEKWYKTRHVCDQCRPAKAGKSGGGK